MQILTTIASVPKRPESTRRVLVPTMGALHKGHLELIQVARNHAALGGEVVVSIFVNPLQFEPGSDYERYPRPESVDEELCRSAGVDLLFRPEAAEMYPGAPSVVVEETSLSKALCGRSRPGHFRGVCTVVAKLFHILSPTIAIFGEKDFQQLAIIRRLVGDLNFKTEIVGVPTVREADGLALSSRNQYLDPEERKQAGVLRQALVQGAELARAGESSSARVVTAVRKTIEDAPLARIDYVELVDAENLEKHDAIQPNSLLALAVFFGKTRLIDNIRLP